MKDYYHILGVDPHCPQAEIKKAYRQLAVKHHPDKNPGDKKSEERFKLIAEAYVVLNDVAARNEYDYNRGYKSVYKGRGTLSGKPSPIQYLLQIKAIKNRVLTNGGQVNRQELFNLINSLLSDENISHLLAERDSTTNNLIVDEVLTCCIFLHEPLKSDVYTRLEKLATHYHGFKDKVHALENHTATPLPKPEPKKDESIPRTAALLIFGLLALVVLLLLLLR
ncbi:J domain-containing protein [Flavobacterium sp. RHBU_3]|uniref:J domain-containing protein n=1 Tax=Flavobacterium sp. RHBU_3 TaxID=3391184 RepID=UPI003984DBE2